MAIPKISEREKFLVGIKPQTLNNNTLTGAYFDLRPYRRALALAQVAAMADTKTAKIEFFQATDLAGAGGKVVKQSNASAGTESSATATAPLLATKATILLASAIATNKVTINGLVFEGKAGAADLPTRKFSIDTSDTAAALSLVACVNDATYGVPGVTASASTGTVTLTANDPAKTTISITAATPTTVTPAVLECQLYSELDIGDLDIAGGFYFVAPKLTVTSNSTVAVVVLLGGSAYVPAQKVGASTVI